MKIAVVDYCKGNLRSVQKGLESVGSEAFITADPEQIAVADAVVLPGVGAFADASQTMIRTGQMQAVRESVMAGKPFLGICLGLHLLYDSGEEGGDGHSRGLGVLSGNCAKLPNTFVGQNGETMKVKIPHVGWNTVDYTDYGKDCPLFADVPDSTHFYFTHSYACIPDDERYTAATTDHGRRFVSAVWKDNIYGVQFHPEKSSAAGMRILSNFVNQIMRGL